MSSGSGIDVRAFTVGPVQENCYILRDRSTPERGVIVDPGDEGERLIEAIGDLGVTIEAILITHCHFDHIGGVATVAGHTGAPVYCPELEVGILADVMRWVPPGFGPFESYQADQAVGGDERLRLGGLEIEVLFTPGHSPGHVTYAIAAGKGDGASPPGGSADERVGSGDLERVGVDATERVGVDAVEKTGPVLASGDVLFAGSVGRVDLPGGDWKVLEASIGMLLERFDDETVIYPGHMAVTTLGVERQGNPFLSELRAVRAGR